ncbi:MULTISPECIES: alpha/beta fold hydrolase [unclassified Neorhizobium]|uniref:alpha/beta fold hydrolase n=1 Tax=unclassified Neorhizobium TaxID=2629175 RepID=UPI001FF17864|nr:MULTISPECIES: alpha/beta fold hydrolase [unclassified Neorhizobium]MCJ9674329.1 alpha/beta fold hydrolase [Neorhizobium sp. SHOUNA12B]MCJ9748462.1 alpha/beta fold hydrolase [Neorhizobium sp. SHOUNA12A]
MNIMFSSDVIVTLALAGIIGTAASADIERTDRFVELAGGERLLVREVKRRVEVPGRSAVLLVHGARVPGLASFDLPVEGGSLAADLAAEGHKIYILDLRGYGASSRPPGMDGPPEGGAPLARTADAVADIGAAVDAISGWSGDDRVSLVGWATGGHWVGAYASENPKKVERAILYNTLYGGSDEHPTLGRGSPLDDKESPGTFDTAAFGAYRLNTRESLFTAWDKSIPAADKSQWRDPSLAKAYGDAALASDPTTSARNPPSFRAPSGAMADSFELALDRRQWDASALSMPVLVIRSQLDFWSRSADAETIAREAPNAQLVTIPNATHFVHLDRDRAGRAAFMSALLRFLRT